MSKMGQELECRLDENKHRLYEALKELNECYHTNAYNDIKRVNEAWSKAKQVLVKVESK